MPAPDGGPPTVLVYRRVQAATGKRLGLHQGWKYEYDPGRTTVRAPGSPCPWSARTAQARRRGTDATPGGNADE